MKNVHNTKREKKWLLNIKKEWGIKTLGKRKIFSTGSGIGKAFLDGEDNFIFTQGRGRNY